MSSDLYHLAKSEREDTRISKTNSVYHSGIFLVTKISGAMRIFTYCTVCTSSHFTR